MKIKMLQTVNGKVNGVKMGPYTEGVEYDLDTERAELFIGSSMAEEVVEVRVVLDAEIDAAVGLPPRRSRNRLLGV